jgi:hypothetical protein
MAIHALQDGGNEYEFECAAHGEPLIRAVLRALAGCSVEHGNAEPATVGLLNLCESCGQLAETPRSSMEKTRQRENGSGEKRSAAKHTLSRTICLWAVQCT